MCKHIKIHLREVLEMFSLSFIFDLFIHHVDPEKDCITIEGKKVYFNDLDADIVKLVIERCMSGLAEIPYFIDVDYENTGNNAKPNIDAKKFTVHLSTDPDNNWIRIKEGEGYHPTAINLDVIEGIIYRGISDLSNSFKFIIVEYSP